MSDDLGVSEGADMMCAGAWPTSAEYHDSMKDYERSTLDGFDYMTLPLTADVEAPSGSLGKDPRSVTACRHAWDGTWGAVGERQHHCTTCQRWIWEHSIAEASPREQTQWRLDSSERGSTSPTQ